MFDFIDEHVSAEVCLDDATISRAQAPPSSQVRLVLPGLVLGLNRMTVLRYRSHLESVNSLETKHVPSRATFSLLGCLHK